MLIILFLLWIIFNGKLTLEVLALGLIITGAVGLLNKAAFGYTLSSEKRFWRVAPLLLGYAFCLVWAVIQANCAVAWAIWNRHRPLHQTLVTLNMDYRHSLTRYLFANSITLTPGTITVSVYDNSYVVHCLSDDLLEGVETGTIAKILGKVDALL